MPTLKKSANPRSVAVQKRIPVAGEKVGRDGGEQQSRTKRSRSGKKYDALRPADSLERVPKFAKVLTLPKAFMALTVELGTFLLGALPENAPKIAGLGYYAPGSAELTVCCVPSKGGILLLDMATFVEPVGAGAEDLVREHKFLAFLPMPSQAMTSNATLHFEALQEDGIRTEFALEMKPLQKLEGALRASVMREYRHLFAPAVSALLPAKHPLRAAGQQVVNKAAKALPRNAVAAPASVTVAPVPRAQGFFDEIIEGRAEGWAHDPANPKQRLVVEILEGDRVVGRGVADRFRDDLLNAGIGDGRYCFKVPISYELRDGQPHQLTARIAKTKQILRIKGGGSHHLLQHAPFDKSDFDFIPAKETFQLAATIAAGLGSEERRRQFAYSFGNANLSLETRELTDAARNFFDLIHKYGEHPLFFCKVSECYVLSERLGDALGSYKRALDVAPGFGFAWFGLAGVSRKLGDLAKAKSAYAECAKQLPDFEPAVRRVKEVTVQLLKHEAQDLCQKGEHAKAASLLKDHLTASPDDDEALKLLERAMFPNSSEEDAQELRMLSIARELFEVTLAAAEARLKVVA